MPTRVLIAEDDRTTARIVEYALKDAEFDVTVTYNGKQAFEEISRSRFDAVVSDWMMPEMDGIELVRHIRQEIRPAPKIIITTSLASEDAKRHSLAAGADHYLAKPVKPTELVQALESCILRDRQPEPVRSGVSVRTLAGLPPMVGICVGASTGGPDALRRFVAGLDTDIPAAIMVTNHGPAWLMRTMVGSLQAQTKLPVLLAEDGMVPKTGQIHLCPGDCHLTVDPLSCRLRLDDGPPENYVKPAVDPLFRSAARTFGGYCMGIVLSGMGRDGSPGAEHIRSVGGTMFAQDPETATASGMPGTLVKLGLADKVLALEEMAAGVTQASKTAARKLDAEKRGASPPRPQSQKRVA